MLIQILLILWAIGDVLWWRAADLRLRRVRAAVAWRMLLGAFMAWQLVYLAFIGSGVLMQRQLDIRPMVWSVAAYLWHFLLLPAALILLVARKGPGQVFRRLRRRAEAPALTAEGLAEVARPSISRREALGAVVVALPPLVTLAITSKAMPDLGKFRVQRLDLHIPTLPPDLDGLTVAHVTDLHIGRFLPPGAMQRVAEATNALAADLVVFTGDLLDASALSISDGFEFLRLLDPRNGMVLIEGNHDIMAGALGFEGAMKSAGAPLLLDEQQTFHIPGRVTPVQLLGITWGDLKKGREMGRHGRSAEVLFRDPTPEAQAASVTRMASLRRSDAFPVLLAHHPHAFDPAAEAGFPLILSGHTHGGQLMLTKNIGAGPIRFRYWQGLYHKPKSQLFISNGVGNWFPLRVNAPAEIVHLTLHTA